MFQQVDKIKFNDSLRRSLYVKQNQKKRKEHFRNENTMLIWEYWRERKRKADSGTMDILVLCYLPQNWKVKPPTRHLSMLRN